MRKLLVTAGLAIVLGAPNATDASTSVITLTGNCWETGTISPSNPGDELTAVGIVTAIKRPLYWSPYVNAYTWSATDLVSLGERVYGATHITDYTGGRFRIHIDALPSNASFGVNPPNATAPSTFTDGHGVYLDGAFSTFTVLMNTSTNVGAAFGALTFTGGNAYPNLTNPQGWTVSVNIYDRAPQGYDADWNAALFVAGPSAVENVTWGGLKTLYR